MVKRGMILLNVCVLVFGIACRAAEKPVIDTLSSASVQEAHIETTSKEMLQLYEELNKLKDQLEQYESEQKAEQNRYIALQESASHLLEALDEEKLKEIAKKEWRYELLVNGEPVEDTDRLVLETDEVVISLSERFQDPSVLPQELLSSGRISTDYRSHLTLSTDQPYQESGRDGTVVTTTEYVFKDLKSGSSIMLELSGELMERLNTNVKIYTIKVK